MILGFRASGILLILLVLVRVQGLQRGRVDEWRGLNPAEMASSFVIEDLRPVLP